MKQATCIAEVQSLLQHQKALHHVAEMLQGRHRDDELSHDVLTVNKLMAVIHSSKTINYRHMKKKNGKQMIRN